MYQDVLGVDLFMSSDGAEAAEALFNAYRTGEAEQVAMMMLLHQTEEGGDGGQPPPEAPC